MMRRAMLLGVGAVTPLGSTFDATWQALLAGRRALAPSTRFRCDGARTAMTAEIPPTRIPLEGAAPTRNLTLLDAVLSDPGLRSLLEKDIEPPRRGLYAAIRRPDEEGLLGPEVVDHPGELAMRATRLGVGGPRLLLHDACASGAALLQMALDDLRIGRVDQALVVAVNADLSLETLAHYELLGALCPGSDADASIPFDRRRRGFVRGEGAAAALLHGVDQPRDGIELAGAASTADGGELTAGDPEQRGLLRLLEDCLRDAAVSPAQIAHISAHGTATPLGDRNEARAVDHFFRRSHGVEPPPLTALKGRSGHASFASSLLEALVAARSLESGRVPSIANGLEADPQLPELDLVVGDPRGISGEHALSISSAFGGLNSAVVLRRLRRLEPDDAAVQSNRPSTER